MSYFNLQGLQGEKREAQKKANRLYASFKRKFLKKVDTKKQGYGDMQCYEMIDKNAIVNYFLELKKTLCEEVYNRLLRNFQEGLFRIVNLKKQN